MLDAIEKVRKLLSGNKEADLTCESLLDDIDFNTSISRDEFEKMIFAFT
jgi:hypoxia up-regulated 1